VSVISVANKVATDITMENINKLRELGFSKYEISCYLSLLSSHPINGSQLSRLSGISRSRIYDVLRNMTKKGLALEVENGLYAPLPPDELMKRLRTQFDSNLSMFKKEIKTVSKEANYEYIWFIRGYLEVMKKAGEMIRSAHEELYVRLFPKAGEILEKDLKDAEARGVGIRYVAMGDMPLTFDIQVVHPETESLADTIGGRSFDIISDKSESLVGIFEPENEDLSPINWTRNRLFIISARDSLRHDFYHYFLQKVYDRKQQLTEREKRIYEFIKSDD
jgi:HTH-type transcriptional regulator, sugar sensing transcriptional regulator